MITFITVESELSCAHLHTLGVNCLLFLEFSSIGLFGATCEYDPLSTFRKEKKA